MPIAIREPTKIPIVKNKPINVPTYSFESSGALEGALMAH